MGIVVEFNPDLALRSFGSEGRGIEECLPEVLEKGCVYDFLKKGHRLYYFSNSEWWGFGQIPLCETFGDEKLSRPIASIRILEATHFLKGGEVWTRGKYEVFDVFDALDSKINFEGLKRV